ncbi:MAG: DUF58 domain-containing protein [Anaerolineae bacterium]|nr:DUF58 domain-containing protein [Anaerolineae bacterium]
MSNRRIAIYILLIAVLLAGLLSGRPIMFTIAYVLGGLLLASFVLSWAGVSWVRIRRRTVARRAQVGNEFGERFEVMNTGLLPKLWLEVLDHSTLPGYHASQVVPALLPKARYRWETRTICTVRGEYQLGPVTVASGDPFGLFRLTRTVAATSKIIVYPATIPIDDFALPSGLLSGGDAQRRRTHFVTTNAAGVRDYAPGDSFNRIHWRSTARKSRLLVKEFELDPLADVWIFLDLSASSLVELPGARAYSAGFDYAVTPFYLPPSTEEYGVIIAASIARHFLDKGRNLGLVTYGPHREVLHADRSQRQLGQILELLAVVKSGSDFDLEHMLSLNTEYLGRGTTVILITADQTEGWVREAHTLSRRGIRLVAVLLDPVSFGGTVDTTATQARLATFHVPTYVVRAGDDLSAVLSQPLY